jgi:predicted ATPase/class 3 adenylate cyclase
MGGVSQPAGTVTLVFTDIEGSTRLLHELGTSAYKEALAEHRRIVREACARYSGYEVDDEGDAFFYAFASAKDAVSAVSEAMEGLKQGPIQVRVGIHTGEPELDPPKYVGMDVHTAARIMSAGHGGQVVVSPTTQALLDDELVSLGSHRLKDLSEPITLYQLHEGSFPPLKTIANTNLPTPASSFLGREAELLSADALLNSTRLLTIAGPGGQGKTRFALELARRAREERFSDYPDGVFSCFLSSLRDSSLVLATICQTLNVKEQPGSSALEALSAHLQGKKLLLLCDNLEHLLEAALELSELLQQAEGLTLLVTSRELLRIQGETSYALPPLAEDEGIALFCERAKLEPSSEIAELSTRLEGLPLAIELAAARTSILSPRQLLERLSQRLDLLKGTRDADPRQQTLRATIEWSYDLLSPDERRLFRALSVFAGGCTLDAAEEVCDADLDTLHALVDKSLLRFTEERFWLLETIREYAAARLQEAGEADVVWERHAEWMAELLEADPGGAALEVDNLRGALAWSRDAERGALELRLAHATRRYWANAGRVREGLHWLLGAAERGPDDQPEQRAMVMTTAMFCAMRVGDTPRALEIAEAQLDISRVVGGSALVAGLGGLASVHEHAGDLERSVELFEQALNLAYAEGSPSVLAATLFNSAAPEYTLGNYERAQQLYSEARDLFRACEDAQGEAHALVALADCSFRLGRMDEGLDNAREGLRRLHALDLPRLVAEALVSFADVARTQGRWESAGTLLGAHGAILEEAGEVHEPSLGDLCEEIRLACRSGLGSEQLAAVVMRGASMSRNEAVEYALASID